MEEMTSDEAKKLSDKEEKLESREQELAKDGGSKLNWPNLYYNNLLIVNNDKLS